MALVVGRYNLPDGRRVPPFAALGCGHAAFVEVIADRLEGGTVMALGEDVFDDVVRECPRPTEPNPFGLLDREGIAGAFTDQAALELGEAGNRVAETIDAAECLRAVADAQPWRPAAMWTWTATSVEEPGDSDRRPWHRRRYGRVTADERIGPR